MIKQIIPVVAACIVKRHPMRILIHRKDESRNPELIGKWEFPGGKIKYKETPEQALKREIGEELEGIIIQVNRLLHAKTNIYSNGEHYHVLYYECQTSYEATPNNCRWIAPWDIKEFDCLPGTYEVAKILLGGGVKCQ